MGESCYCICKTVQFLHSQSKFKLDGLNKLKNILKGEDYLFWDRLKQYLEILKISIGKTVFVCPLLFRPSSFDIYEASRTSCKCFTMLDF